MMILRKMEVVLKIKKIANNHGKRKTYNNDNEERRRMIEDVRRKRKTKG